MPLIVDPLNQYFRVPTSYSLTSVDVARQIISELKPRDWCKGIDLIDYLLKYFPEDRSAVFQLAYKLFDNIRHTTYFWGEITFNLPLNDGRAVLIWNSGLNGESNGYQFDRHVLNNKSVIYSCDLSRFQRLPFEDESFDFIYCLNLLENSPDPSRVCREAARVAKMGYIECYSAGDLWDVTIQDHAVTLCEREVQGVWKSSVLAAWRSIINDLDINSLDFDNPHLTDREKVLLAALWLQAGQERKIAFWYDDIPLSVKRVLQSGNQQSGEQQSGKPGSGEQGSVPKLSYTSLAYTSLDSQGSTSSRSVSDANGLNQAHVQPVCVFIGTYYNEFLLHHYQRNQHLLNASYSEQLHSLLAQRFGDSDFYSYGLSLAGWKTYDLITNCSPLDMAWRRENGTDYLRGALKLFRPDVVYCQDMHSLSPELLKEIRSCCRVLVGQIASSFSNINWSGYDFVVSSLPVFVDYIRKQGVPCYYQPLAFEDRILKSDLLQPWKEREIDFSFVGNVSGSQHPFRGMLLEQLAGSTPVQIWGSGVQNIVNDSPIHASYRGEAWGNDMFAILGKSRITLNCHGDCILPAPDGRNASREYANNMRLFEATGCGALLITDYRPNLGQLFEIGREIVAYSSIDECITLVKYYLEHPDEAAEIAARGQERTLRDHTYTKRMHQMSQWFKQLLNRKSAQKNIGGSSVPVSTGYEKIDISTVNSQDKVGWLSIDIPSRQRELVDNELEQLYKGEVIKPFAVLAELLKSRLSANCTVLEIGCSSGYYSEVLEYLLLRTIDYHGVDISSAMIALARSIYPDRHFYVGDGKELPFRDREFNCVISGCVLLHDTAYSDQIKETCRVTEQWLVAHRTPIHRQSPTSCYRKQAYGIDTVELHFNERELLDLFRQGGFILLDSIEYSSDPVQDRYDVSYLFRRFC